MLLHDAPMFNKSWMWSNFQFCVNGNQNLAHTSNYLCIGRRRRTFNDEDKRTFFMNRFHSPQLLKMDYKDI